MEKLAKDEELEGLGGADGGPGGDEAGKSNTTLSLDECLKEAEDFANNTQQKLLDELKETCSGMPRAFCVSTVQGKTNIETGDSTVEYHSHRVLVGAQDKIDAA